MKGAVKNAINYKLISRDQRGTVVVPVWPLSGIPFLLNSYGTRVSD